MSQSHSLKNLQKFSPFRQRSLLQESPSLREETNASSPRRKVSYKTSLSRERTVFHNPSLPEESMSFNMLPFRDGARELHSPSLYPQYPIPQYPYPTMACYGRSTLPFQPYPLKPAYSYHTLAHMAYHTP